MALGTTTVSRLLTRSPITSRREVNQTSGISANGIPNESTTCESTRVRDGSTPDGDDDERRQHRHRAAHPERDLPPDEPLHHDLTRERPDRRRREPGREQRDGEERPGRGAEDRLERLVRALERVDVGEAAHVERARRHDQHRAVDQHRDRHRDQHVEPRVAHQHARALSRTRARSGPGSAPSAGRSRAASRSRRGSRPRAAPTPTPANEGTRPLADAPRHRGARRRSRSGSRAPIAPRKVAIAASNGR